MRRALAVVIVLMMVIPAVAAARQGGGARNERVPSAQLWTEGSGVVTFTGRLSLTGSIPGRGSLVVTDREGDARAHLAGVQLQFDRRGRAKVRRATGILFVTGSKVTVQVVGDDLSFSVAGLGRARFLGVGEYELNGGPEKEWAPTWIRLAPSSSSPERRRAPSCASCSSSVVPSR